MEQVDKRDEFNFVIVDFEGFIEYLRDILQEGGFLNLKFIRKFVFGKMSLGVISLQIEGY